MRATPSQFFEIELEDNETVALNLHFLVGFSGLKALQTCIGLSAPAVIAGKVFIQYATGPGRLYFQASGPPVSAEQGSGRFASHRMIVWKLGTAFQYGGLLRKHDVFLNDAMLSLADESQDAWVLLDVDSQSDNSRHLWGLMMRLLIP